MKRRVVRAGSRTFRAEVFSFTTTKGDISTLEKGDITTLG